jgi:hypothetical protein
MMRGKQHRNKRNRGNASVETILVALVMVPLFGGVTLLGKLADVSNATAQSSRYLAWEHATTGSSDRDFDREIRERFFSNPALRIRSNDGDLNDEQRTNPMWTGYGVDEEGRQNLLISHESDMESSVENQSPGSVAESISRGVVTIGQTMARFTGGEWELEENGLITATVAINAASNPFMPTGLDCDNQESENVATCVTRSNAILVDGWEVSDVNHAELRTRTLVPAAGLEEVGAAAVEAVGRVPFFADLGRLQTDENGGFGYVDSEVVPMDRYAED